MSLLDLPEDVLRQVATNLSTSDLLQFLSSHGRFHKRLGKSPDFWKFLLNQTDEEGDPRQRFMIQSCTREVPLVKWYPMQNCGVVPFEGHLSCVFSTLEEDLLCITGGFTNDPAVYMMRINRSSLKWDWVKLINNPEGPRSFVYGATLTTLDENRAVRFGGFEVGDDFSETKEVVLLERLEGPGNTHRFRWQVIPTQNPEHCFARAYHTATLLAGRYLLVLGGMTSMGCLMMPAILDTQSWTWLDAENVMSFESTSISHSGGPSGRQRHSVVLDELRNRVVLFGGAARIDMWRCGSENGEVWELKMGEGWQNNLEESFPWTWSRIWYDPDKDGLDDTDSDSDESETFHRPVSCLGNCHVAVKSSPDTAILVFQSARQSTNNVIAYNLRTDQFIRPKILDSSSTLRFNYVSAFYECHGYLMLHGAYSLEDGPTLGGMAVLDLAPFATEREQSTYHRNMVIHTPSYGPVTEEEAQQVKTRSEQFLRQMFEIVGEFEFDPRFLGLTILEHFGQSFHRGQEWHRFLAAQLLHYFILKGEYGGLSFMNVNKILLGFGSLRYDGDRDDCSDY